MREAFDKIEETMDHVKTYVNTRIAQAKLGAAEKASDMISIFIAKLMAACVLFFFVFFLSEAAAIGLGEYFGKAWLGYLMVAGIYLLLGLIIWFARERLLRIPIMNAIIARLFKNNTEQNEKD
ncbi:MAG: phage holin family protein [Chitinophagales bacterium]